MRHRSPTNSRPHENIPLRNQYRLENPYCELHRWMTRNMPTHLRLDDRSAELHHIEPGCRTRPDLWSNMIVLSRPIHVWAQSESEGKLLCLWWKKQKLELSLEEHHAASGRYLAGWLDMHCPKHPALQAVHAELVSFCERKDGK